MSKTSLTDSLQRTPGLFTGLDLLKYGQNHQLWIQPLQIYTNCLESENDSDYLPLIAGPKLHAAALYTIIVPPATEPSRSGLDAAYRISLRLYPYA